MKEKDEETAEIGQRSPKFVNFPPRTDTTGVAASGLQLFLDTEIDNTPTDYWLSVTGHHTRASLPRKFALKHLKSDASRLHIGLLLGTDLIKQIWHIEPKNISIDLWVKLFKLALNTSQKAISPKSTKYLIRWFVSLARSPPTLFDVIWHQPIDSYQTFFHLPETETRAWMGANKLFGNPWRFPLAIHSAAAQPTLQVPTMKDKGDETAANDLQKEVEIITLVPTASQASKPLSLLDATEKPASFSAVAQPKSPTITEEKDMNSPASKSVSQLNATDKPASSSAVAQPKSPMIKEEKDREIIKSVPIASPATTSSTPLDATDKPEIFSTPTPSVPPNIEPPAIHCQKQETPPAATTSEIVPITQASTTTALVSPALAPEESNMTLNAASAWRARTNHSGVDHSDELATVELDKPSFADDSFLLPGLVWRSLIRIDWRPGRPPTPVMQIPDAAALLAKILERYGRLSCASTQANW